MRHHVGPKREGGVFRRKIGPPYAACYGRGATIWALRSNEEIKWATLECPVVNLQLPMMLITRQNRHKWIRAPPLA